MRRLDVYELTLLAVFALLSLWVVALDLDQVWAHHRVWTGTDGVYIVDQMQYLSWVRSASEHFLSANLFTPRGTAADYFMPMMTVSAGLVKLGISAPVALILWKPVAVGAMFVATRAIVRATLPPVWPQRIALTLALFFGGATVFYGSFTVLGDLYPVFLSWGYTPALLSLACMVGVLVLYAADRDRGRIGPWPAVLGCATTLLHPWHGELLAITLVLAEAACWLRHDRRGWRPLIPALAGIGVVLAYYWALGKGDLSWHLARGASKHAFPLWPILLDAAPLAVPALFALRRAPRDWLGVALRAWPLATLVEYVLSSSVLGATPLHAFEGVTVPLAILAVEGVRGLPRPGRLTPRVAAGLTVVLLVVLTVPGGWLQLRSERRLAAPTANNANFITPSERDAVEYLARDRTAGIVLTRSYLGAYVPERTGRRVLVGDCLWSEPGCLTRTALAFDLFSGTMTGATARAFVADTGARFLLSDCGANADLRATLAPVLVSVHRFGCASVYEVSPPEPHAGLWQTPTRCGCSLCGAPTASSERR